MIFAKEEIVHTQMFRRYMKVAGLEAFPPPPALHDLFVNKLPNMAPVIGVLCTYLIENVAEIGALDGTDFDQVEPQTRHLFRTHHIEEARHLAFGRWVVEHYVASGPPEGVAALGGMAKEMMSRMVPQYTYNPEIGVRLRHLGIDPESADVDAVRRSPNNQTMNARRFDEMLGWLKSLGLVAQDHQWF
jgi:hypothetical protein